MFDHLSIGVTNFERSLIFYDALMSVLKHKRSGGDEAQEWIMYGEKPECFVVNTPLDQSRPAQACNGSHICFRAADKSQVDHFHHAALKHGGKDGGAPGYRPEYDPDYYAAFVFDPDGHKLEAVAYVPPES